VKLLFERDFNRMLAGYLEYDVLDVVPRADGMNLVALEGPVVNRRDGVVVLSKTAGAHQILAPYARAVDPGAVHLHVGALRDAVTMAPGERSRRARGLREIASAGDPSAWLLSQVEDAARWRASGAAG
jgi:trehalose 6-phosphate synthase